MADLSVLMPVLIVIGTLFVVLLGIAALAKKFYIKVEQGTALIINTLRAKPKLSLIHI